MTRAVVLSLQQKLGTQVISQELVPSLGTRGRAVPAGARYGGTLAITCCRCQHGAVGAYEYVQYQHTIVIEYSKLGACIRPDGT